MELIERFEKLGFFIYSGLFVLFFIFGRAGNVYLYQYCALPLGICIGLIWVGIGTFRMHRRYAMTQFGRRTKGVLADVRKVQHTYHPIVEFIADNGQVLKHKAQSPTLFDLHLVSLRQIGKEVNIVYTLAQPIEVYIVDTVSFWGTPIMNIVWGTTMIVAFIYLYVVLLV